MTSNPGRVYNVVLFGDVGSGKSSTINLLAEKPVANVSTGVDTCTKRARWYPVTIEDKDFRLWDTMGFNQPEAQDVNLLSLVQAHTLLQNLPNGPDLILLCARKDGISASLHSLYWLLDSFLFGGRAKIALVLTHFDTPDDGWWDRNKQSISQGCKIPESLPYACITTVGGGSAQSESVYDQSKSALRSLLKTYATTSETAAAVLSLDLSSDVAGVQAAENLKNHFRLNILDAQALVAKFRSPKRSFNVILFGEAGVGKSSVINLLIGKSVASVFAAANICTVDFCSYEINTGLCQFLIWDTVGFNGRHGSQDATLLALEKAALLARDLHSKGGVDLLVLCKNAGRLTSTELNTLRLFREFLCDSRIPVSFIITHLEDFDRMEDWWRENEAEILRVYKVIPAGHACITSMPDNPRDQRFYDKRSQSRQSVEAMLEDSVSYGHVFENEGIWVMSFLKRLAELVTKAGGPVKRISAEHLANRCGLTEDQANEVIKLLPFRG